jgi:hypothetical protein
MHRTLLAIAIFVLLGSSASRCAAAEPAVDLFENSIRPLLTKHCIECHGAAKQESGLRVDSHAALLTGGDRGAAVVPGKPAESLLLDAVKHVDDLEMPPETDPLPAEAIDSIAKWIEQGAAWPSGVSLSDSAIKLRSGAITDEERAFWSFQPLAAAQPPQVKNTAWSAGDIDRFVLAKLEAADMRPAPPAEKRALLRRVTFDLTGLPPTPEEVQNFLADESPEALAKVVDRLLASQSYGERWGRHWLDVARYADTAGETADYPVREAYRYRDYVIAAFNSDKPYDQFIREQIAGDIYASELAQANGSNWNDESLARYEELVAATGFIASSRRFGFDPQNYHHLTIQDTIDTTCQAVLGLSVGCARCHDHKFDPVNREDYYALYGIFASTRYAFPGSEEVKRPRDFPAAVPPTIAAEKQAKFDTRVNELKTLIAANDAQKATYEAELASLELAGAYPVLYSVVEAQPHDERIQRRGEPANLAEVAPRRWLEILGKNALAAPNTSGRRELADWMTSPKNPLTARVMVNRIWQQHFGQGLVRTPSDFGVRGQLPTHPELLDWLAARFIESGWSMKAMHRLILLSRAYQIACVDSAAYHERDPENKLLWTFNRRRLSAEEIRDALLFVGGGLDRSPAGPHPFPPVNSWGYTQHGPFADIYPTNRRSVYLMTPRLKRHPYLALFDGADPNAGTATRLISTVPTQALFLMNSTLVHEQSAALGQKLASDNAEESVRLQTAWRTALARDASEKEIADAAAFLAAYREKLTEAGVPPEQREAAAWSALVRTLIVRNEFLFVE